jgi:phage terminase large subunit
MGFNIKPSKKGADSIRVGIDTMRRHKLHIKSDSLNAQKEFRNYKWKTDKNGKMLSTPVDAYNHLIDAVRYVCLNKILRRTGKYFIQ